jgi:hypothetical protein
LKIREKMGRRGEREGEGEGEGKRREEERGGGHSFTLNR